MKEPHQEPHKEKRKGLRPPPSMPQKTYDIVFGAIFFDVLLLRLGTLLMLLGAGDISLPGLLVMALLPICVVVGWFKSYKKTFGLEPIEGKREQDKEWLIAFFILYLALPYIITLIIEPPHGRTALLMTTGVFILIYIGCAMINGFFMGLDYLRFTAFKKEYLKNRALVLPVVMPYVREKYPDKDIRVSVWESAVTSKIESLDRFTPFYNYEFTYKDEGVTMMFPYILRLRFKKKHINNCFFSFDYFDGNEHFKDGFAFTFGVHVKDGQAVEDNFASKKAWYEALMAGMAEAETRPGWSR